RPDELPLWRRWGRNRRAVGSFLTGRRPLRRRLLTRTAPAVRYRSSPHRTAFPFVWCRPPTPTRAVPRRGLFFGIRSPFPPPRRAAMARAGAARESRPPPDRRSADAVPLAGPANAVDGAVRSDPRPAAGRRDQPVQFDSRWERDFPMTTRALL